MAKSEIICIGRAIQINNDDPNVPDMYISLEPFWFDAPELWTEVQQVFEIGTKKHKGNIQKPSVQFEHLLEHHGKSLDSVDEESGLSNKAHFAARALLLFYSLIAEEKR